MNGTVVGGWEFVWAAYSLTGVAFAIYGAMVIRKLREHGRGAGRQGSSR